MGSSRQEDRSLTSGISLPQWMKTKFDNRYDFDERAFSPPSHDDSFFCAWYQRGNLQQQTQHSQQNQTRSNHQQQQQQQQQKQQQHSCKEVKDNEVSSSTNLVTSNRQNSSVFKDAKNIDFSKHPAPCLPYIPNAEGKVSDVKPVKTIIAGNVKPKSQGTDDGFQSDPALCGRSIVQVANQMITNQMSSKHAKVHSGELKMMGTEQQRNDRHDQVDTSENFLELKKGSKSLPATPLTSPMVSPDSSPKSRRKHVNRYFTGPFIPDKEKYQGSWLLASILGQSRELVPGKIEEEDESGMELVPPKALSRKKSISSQNLTYIGKDEKFFAASKQQPINSALFQPKPSELREMNFWSPTSM